MDLRSLLTWQKLMDALRSLSNLRISVSRSTLLTISALTLIVFIALSIRLLPIRWGLELSEFDPYFHFQLTEKITEDGYFNWVTWTTSESHRWYPNEVLIGRAAVPGLALTSATLYNILSILGVPISLYHFCVLFPALFGTLTCIMAYFLGKDIGGQAVGIFSAFFLALNPSHITRTSAGFFDDETVGIFGILLFIFLFLRALDEERPQKHSLVYAVTSGLMLGYVTASWGAALYPIAMVTVFVVALVLMGRFSRRLLISYSITFGLGLFLAINVPRNNISYLESWAILPVLGVFGLLCFKEALSAMKARKSKIILIALFLLAIVVGFLALEYMGYSRGISGKFLRVLDPTQRAGSQIYQSVQEHRLTAWGSMFYDWGVGVFFFLLGLFFAVRDLTSRKLLAIIFALTALFFASSIVRLTILLAPAFSFIMALGIVNLVKPFVILTKEIPRIPSGRRFVTRVGKEFSGVTIILVFLLLTLTFVMPFQNRSVYNHAYQPPTILAASLPLKPVEPITEWTETLEWMKLNLPEKAIICSWWDYGYWIAVRANRTSLADNATFNSTHIGLIGKVFMSNETVAVENLKEQFNGPDGPPTHILVFTTFNSLGGDQGYGDEGKWRWMARIANQTVAPGFYHEWGEREEYNTFGNITEDRWMWNDLGKNTTIYKLMQMGKHSIVPSAEEPQLKYFKVSHFSPGNPAATLGEYQDQQTGQTRTAYLHALVCLYEVDYQQYEIDHPTT